MTQEYSYILVGEWPMGPRLETLAYPTAVVSSASRSPGVLAVIIDTSGGGRGGLKLNNQCPLLHLTQGGEGWCVVVLCSKITVHVVYDCLRKSSA